MNTRTTQIASLFLTSLLIALPGCGSEDPPADAEISLVFAPMVGAEDFACGQTFTGLGASGDQSLTIRDARLYVHNVRLVDGAGAEVPLELTQDGQFQRGGLAYLDFADSSISGCEGNPETRLRIEGTAPAGDYVGVRFSVGVPFEDNHQDSSVADAPLNVTDMFWAWQSGYKFIRLDGESTGLPAWRFHLGSTACVGDPTMGGVTSCTNPNRVEVALDGMDVANDVIRVDFGALVDDDDLNTQTVDTPAGCMSGPMDPDCAGYFGALGLAHGSNASGAQRVFLVD